MGRAATLPTWRQRFNARTSDLMGSLRQRHKRKKLPPPAFELEDLRRHLLGVLGNVDGVIQCRYCRGWLDITNLGLDHKNPINRGGGLGVENIEFPCQGCNSAKGELTPDEFLNLRAFLRSMHPNAEKDVLHRLQIAVQLAGAQNWGRKKAKKGLLPANG